MSEPPKTNPAGRLYHLLSEAVRKNNNRTFGKVWAEVFGIDPEDRGRLLVMLSHLIRQIEEGKEAVRSNPESLRQDLHLKPFEKLTKAFSVMNLDAKWRGWKKSHLPDETVSDLEWCAEGLKQVYPEGEIDGDELTKLREDVEELISEVRKADIEEDLKAVIIDGLEHVRRAIVEYDLRGVDGLVQALEQNIGTIHLHQKELGAAGQASDILKEWAGRLASLKLLIDSASEAYQALPEGSEEFIRGLLTGG